MKQITILGSTGSIGRNTLEVIKHFPNEFRVFGLSTNSNIRILSDQIKKFFPEVVVVRDTFKAERLKRNINNKIILLGGEDGLIELSGIKVELLVMAISGSAALFPLIKAIETQPMIALANKEALVMAGPLINQKVKETGTKIIPIDSEQSAIWQCLEDRDKSTLKKIYLTASGGPLKDIDKRDFRKISLEKVLNHPCWKMGKKITVDSATLMNKGLELFETMYLFGVDISKIDILIHPEAVIHSMVEFIDGSVLAQLSITDMRIPIQYALSYPKRLRGFLKPLNFIKIKNLTFLKPDLNKFPCLTFAYEAAKAGGTLPVVLNASNEIAVESFLKRRINFSNIPKVIEKVMKLHKNIKKPTLHDIISVHQWARKKAEEVVNNFN
ncbi:MAG: 1-deoxy-D-xylulose-5-phosphate reductoisomerase [Candidatus Omnitrophica bacterium]|nr:1-deoxy-D-xylulose-5-phosphate reductoisomerase [Candidatus Omnitrophota bacterium]